MNRNDVVNIMKDIIACGLVPDQIVLVPPNADNVLSEGYQLHVKMSIDKVTEQCLKGIVEPKGCRLHVEPEKRLVVVYKPIEDKRKMII